MGTLPIWAGGSRGRSERHQPTSPARVSPTRKRPGGFASVSKATVWCCLPRVVVPRPVGVTFQISHQYSQLIGVSRRFSKGSDVDSRRRVSGG